jgi:hypothetical protein
MLLGEMIEFYCEERVKHVNTVVHMRCATHEHIFECEKSQPWNTGPENLLKGSQ